MLLMTCGCQTVSQASDKLENKPSQCPTQPKATLSKQNVKEIKLSAQTVK